MIKQYLEAFNVFTNKDIENLIPLFSTRKLSKSDFFIREGETCKEVAFVLSGIFRSFYVSNEGDEITYCISFPNNLMSAYSSFITGQSTLESIQAITTVELLVIPKNIIDNLANENPNWIKFLKIVAEQQYVELEKRIFQIQKNNALQRYKELMENNPEYIQNIPLHYLASYLGITPRHLSRIRKEIVL